MSWSKSQRKYSHSTDCTRHDLPDERDFVDAQTRQRAPPTNAATTSERARPMSSAQKAIIAVGVTGMLGAAVFTTVYLPFYSQAGQERRNAVEAGQVSVPKMAPGGVRGNMNAGARRD